LVTPEQAALDFNEETTVASTVPERSALESDFPVVEISRIAEAESWRKEVHRPATHTHKWWAQRLGSVFRAILVGAVANDGAETLDLYSRRARLTGLAVFDPFAGSGTTIAEACKLGAARVVGRDINPVATLVQRQAVARWSRSRLEDAYAAVERTVREEIDNLHRTESGETVLYWFWVAHTPCPSCSTDVDLFSSRVFARHAYVKKQPIAQALCPHCQDVTPVDLASTSDRASCASCQGAFELAGVVSGKSASCACGHTFAVVDSLRGRPPLFRMYAKLVLDPHSKKRYERVTEADVELYDEAARRLGTRRSELVLPVGALDDGINTRQALRWNYRQWEDFFNSRQLYCLGLLGAAIRDLPSSPEREALAVLFSGVLEFNNRFCSYKGEGTGAVRHMFSHHILKPERTPLEAHPWGTSASSGSFSTLFKSRLLRALEYKHAPTDLVLDQQGVRKATNLSVPLVDNGADASGSVTAVDIACGNSAFTGLPTDSIDLVITDPPYMDNVQYSELADFFHAWLAKIEPFAGYPIAWATTRQAGEVQSDNAEGFGQAIEHVWSETHRVLKPEGLLAFTFHQARISGWVELLKALRGAGFVVTGLFPVKAEMSVGSPKAGAAKPSNLDSVVVCRPAHPRVISVTPTNAANRAGELLRELIEGGVTVGETDIRSVVTGSVLSAGTQPSVASVEGLVPQAQLEAERLVRELSKAA
jgi:putative DNA methylase